MENASTEHKENRGTWFRSMARFKGTSCKRDVRPVLQALTVLVFLFACVVVGCGKAESPSGYSAKLRPIKPEELAADLNVSSWVFEHLSYKNLPIQSVALVLVKDGKTESLLTMSPPATKGNMGTALNYLRVTAHVDGTSNELILNLRGPGIGASTTIPMPFSKTSRATYDGNVYADNVLVLMSDSETVQFAGEYQADGASAYIGLRLETTTETAR